MTCDWITFSILLLLGSLRQRCVCHRCVERVKPFPIYLGNNCVIHTTSTVYFWKLGQIAFIPTVSCTGVHMNKMNNPVLHFPEWGAVPSHKPKFRKQLSQKANNSNSDVKQTQVHTESSQTMLLNECYWRAAFVPVWWWSHWWGGGCVHLSCSVARRSPSGWAGPVVSPCAGALVIAPPHPAGTGHRKSPQTRTPLPSEQLPGPHVLNTAIIRNWFILSSVLTTLLISNQLKPEIRMRFIKWLTDFHFNARHPRWRKTNIITKLPQLTVYIKNYILFYTTSFLKCYV